jgi:RHS repeat-associated protein
MQDPVARSGATSALLLTILLALTQGLATAALAVTVPGRIAGTFDASASGAATYNIPIQVSAGMNGLKPAISLGYNSQAGNGLAGMGWTLNGLSEIRRCGLTRAVDGRVQGVRFTTGDRYCLDGQPLVLVSGTYGGDGSQYRTEVHDFERVFARGRQGNGPAWFEVRQPDGLVYRYGNDGDSRIEAGGTTEVRVWALNEIEDKFAQRIGFAYAEANASGEYRPTEIRWTYGGSETFTQGRYRLVFSWEQRPEADVRSGFLWGTPWTISQRLAAISYEFNSGSGFKRVHRYALAYASPAPGGTQRSRLASITQCGPLDCLPPTTMLWDDASAERLQTTQTSIPVDRAVVGDYNGDGATDVFVGYQGRWAVWPANPQTGGFLPPVTIGGTFDASSVGVPLDYNGDGLVDLMTGSSQGPNWLVFLSPATPGAVFAVKNTGLPWSPGADVQPLDFDGDGLDDLAYLRNGMVYVRRNTGAALGAEQAGGPGPVQSPNIGFGAAAGIMEPADFDGDGRTDLLVARSSESGTSGNYIWEAYLATGTGFAATPIATLSTSPQPDRALVLDINGDSLSDVLVFHQNAWRSYLSRGTSSGTLPGLVQVACAAPVAQGANSLATALDYDGDGRSDLLVSEGNGWRLHRSDGSCFSSQERYTDIYQPARPGISRLVPIDSDGDGNADVMFGGTSPNRWEILRYVPRTRTDGVTIAYRADVLHLITDGLGNYHELTYRPLAGWSGYRASGASTATTQLLRGGPLHVLSQYTANSGVGVGEYTVSFEYANARLDTQGRGFLGFETVKATDSRSGLATETAYRQDFPYTGRAGKVTTWAGTDKVALYEPTWAAFAATIPDAAQDTHFVYLAADSRETYEIDPEGGYRGNLVQSVTRSLAWNLEHGAIANELTAVSGPQHGGFIYRTTRSMAFDDSLRNGAGCFGHPLRIDLTRDMNGNGGQTRTTQFTYDATTCRTLTRTEGPAAQPARQLRTAFTHDSRGRIGSVTQTDGAGISPPRVTRYAYTGLGYRPSAEAQVIAGETDYVTTHAWNDALGLESSRTSPQGQTTSWLYDEFGRVTKETRPNGNTQSTIIACGPCFAPNARYAVRQLRSDGLWSESQHDSFGRSVGRAFVLADGRASRQVTERDASGRVRRESMPYFADAAPYYWVSYTYDALDRTRSVDRPVNEAVPSGAVTQFVYAGLKTTVRDAENRATTYTHDPEGRLTVVTPPLGGVAGASYDEFGQIISTVDAGWNARYMRYDEAGRLIELVDPDAGRRNYSYDTFGNLIAQSDGASPPNSMSLRYDALGRMTSRTEPEGTTTWAYSTATGAARGQLQQVTGPTPASATGFRESYSYDSRGRLQQTNTVIDGSSYQTNFTYGAEDKLASMTYPTTVGWRPKFVFGYSNGHLSTISQDAAAITPVYTLLAMDPQGRESAARFGAGALEERSVYDAASARLTAIRAGPASSPASLQDYAYEWDRVGNLLSRQDLGASPQLREQFAYDALGRLVQVALNGSPTLNMTYSLDGSILSKSDVGSYRYSMSDQRPHAVMSISGGPRGNMSFAYDANGNMTNRNGTAITWTSFNLPKQISAGADYARFTYGPSRGRIVQEAKTGAVTRTTHYVGPHFEVEIEGSVRRYRSNVFAHGRAVFSQVETTPNGLEAYYVLHDHLGSVDRLVRAVGGGANLLATSFDAWGKRRNSNWTADAADQRYTDAHWVERGYTGHEHLDNARLIHMNGRLQDPLLGRMLSPDPFLGGMTNPQALNAYGYVANNPTSYFDPSGYFLSKLRKALKRAVRHVGSTGRRVTRRWGRQIAAAVAAYFTAGAVSSWAYAAQTSAVSISGPAFIAADGFAAAGTLTAASTSGAVLGGMAGGAVAGAIAGGSLRSAVVGGLSGGAMGGIAAHFGGSYSAGRVLAEATVGGVSAELDGGDFGSGFLTSGGLSSLTWAAREMRADMIEQSRLNETGANSSGVSEGFRGDGFKLGGCRAPCTDSPLGGRQGGVGKFLGITYAPGSFVDALVEAYSGPHDFLNSPVFYDSLGNNMGRSRIFDVVNAANVAFATPFAVASVIPSYAYGAAHD